MAINEFFKRITKCPVCGESKNLTSEFDIQYFSNQVIELNGIHEKPDIELIRCKRCNHCFASHILSPKVLDNYYSRINSVIYADNSETHHDNYKKERLNKADLIGKMFPQGGKILDVGCGYGFLLSYLDIEKWERFGVEPSIKASKIAEGRGIKILSNYIDNISDTLRFDVILLFDVIEHLADPNSMIDKLAGLMNKNGALIILTGNIDSLNAKLTGAHWSYFNTYEHISFFNPKSIKFLLTQYKLDDVKIKYCSYEINFLKNCYSFFKNLLRYILFAKLKLRKMKQSPLAFDHFITIAKF